jgi:hypothetical protein
MDLKTLGNILAGLAGVATTAVHPELETCCFWLSNRLSI